MPFDKLKYPEELWEERRKSRPRVIASHCHR